MFLVACDDDDDDGGGSSREAMDSPAPPEARNEGEVIVSFTLTGVDNVTQLSGADFQVTAKKGSAAAAAVGDAAFVLERVGDDGMTTLVDENTTLSQNTVLYLKVTSPSGALTDNALDYTVSLASDSNAMAGTAALDATGRALLSRTAMDVDTDGPDFAAMAPTGSGMAVTVTFDENLLASSVQASDFTIVESDGTTAVAVSAVRVNGMEVVLTLAKDWSSDFEISLAEGMAGVANSTAGIQDANGVYNGALSLAGTAAPDTTPPASFTASVSDDRLTITLDFNEAVGGALASTNFTVTDGTTPVAVSSAALSNGDVVLVLSAALTLDTEYTITVASGGISDTAATPNTTTAALSAMVTPTAAADETAPAGFSAVVDATALTAITLVFDEPVEAVAGTGLVVADVTVAAGDTPVVPTAITINDDGEIVLTVPALTADTTYTVTVLADKVQDAAGNEVAAALTDDVTPSATAATASATAEPIVFGPSDDGQVITITLSEAADARFVNEDGSDFAVYATAAATTVSTAFEVSMASTGMGTEAEGTADENYLLVTIVPTDTTTELTQAAAIILRASTDYDILTESSAMLTLGTVTISEAASTDFTGPTLSAVATPAQAVTIETGDPFAVISVEATEALMNASADDFVITGAPGVEVTRVDVKTEGAAGSEKHYLLIELGATGAVATMAYTAVAGAMVTLGLQTAMAATEATATEAAMAATEASDLSDALGNLVALATPLEIGTAEVAVTADSTAPTASVPASTAIELIGTSGTTTVTLALSEYVVAAGMFDEDDFALNDSTGTASTLFEVKSATFVPHDVDGMESESTVVLVIGTVIAGIEAAGTAVAAADLTLAVASDSDVTDIAGNALTIATAAAANIVNLSWNATAANLTFTEPTSAITLTDDDTYIVTLRAVSSTLGPVTAAATNFSLVDAGTTTAATSYEITGVSVRADDPVTTRNDATEVYVTIEATSAVQTAAAAVAEADFDLVLGATAPMTGETPARDLTLTTGAGDTTYSFKLAYALDNDVSVETAETSKLVGLAAAAATTHYTVTVEFEDAVKFGAGVANSADATAAMTAIDGAFTLVDDDPAGATASTLFDVDSIALLAGTTAVTGAVAAAADRSAAGAAFDKIVFVLESTSSAAPASAATDVYVKWGDTVFTTVSATDAPLLASNVLLAEGLMADGTANEASLTAAMFIDLDDVAITPPPAADATVELGRSEGVGAVQLDADIAFQETLKLSDAAATRINALASTEQLAHGVFKFQTRAAGTTETLADTDDFYIVGSPSFSATSGGAALTDVTTDGGLREATAGGAMRAGFLTVEDIVIRSNRNDDTTEGADSAAVELWLVGASADFTGSASVAVKLADSVIADGTDNDVTVTGVQFMNTPASGTATAADDKDIDVRSSDGMMGETLMTLTVNFEEQVELADAVATAAAAETTVADGAVVAAKSIFSLVDDGTSTADVVSQLEIVAATFNDEAGDAITPVATTNGLFHSTADGSDRDDFGSVVLVVGAANPYLGHGDLDAADLYVDVNVAALGMATDGEAVTDIKPDNGILVAEDVLSTASEVTATVTRTSAADATIDLDATATPNLLTVTLDFDTAVELGSAASAATAVAAAKEAFQLQDGSSPSTVFDIHAATFTNAGDAVTAGTGGGQLTDTAGSGARADFDKLVLVVDSQNATGSDSTAADLYLAYIDAALADASTGVDLTGPDDQTILLLESAVAEG